MGSATMELDAGRTIKLKTGKHYRITMHDKGGQGNAQGSGVGGGGAAGGSAAGGGADGSAADGSAASGTQSLGITLRLNEIPPWRDGPAPTAQLVSSGKVVAEQPIVVENRQAVLVFENLPGDAMNFQLVIPGVEKKARVLTESPRGVATVTPEEETVPDPVEEQPQDGVLEHHDKNHARKDVTGQGRQTITAHARSLGGFYLLGSVGPGAENRTDFDDVRKVQERLWALGYLDEAEIGKPGDDGATVSAIKAFQGDMGADNADGVIDPDGSAHTWLQGRSKLEALFVFAPSAPESPENLLEPGQNPAVRDQGGLPKDASGQPALVVAEGSPLSKLISLFDEGASAKRHYDHVDPLDGITIGCAHWPLKRVDGVFGALLEDPAGDAFCARADEFFRQPQNQPLWLMWQQDAAASEPKAHEYDGLSPTLTADPSVAEIRELTLKTLASESWIAQFKGKTKYKHRPKRLWDLLWVRKLLTWCLRDKRVVGFQVRHWVEDVIFPAQKWAIERCGVQTLGGIAAAVSMHNSRSGWYRWLPATETGDWESKGWKRDGDAWVKSDDEVRLRYTTNGKLEASGKDGTTTLDWKRAPTATWRSYVIWQMYAILKRFKDDSDDFRGRMVNIWDEYFSKCFEKMPHALVMSLPASSQSGELEAGTPLPVDFHPEKPATFASMTAIVPSYQA